MMIFQHRDTERQRPVKGSLLRTHPCVVVLLIVLLMTPTAGFAQISTHALNKFSDIMTQFKSMMAPGGVAYTKHTKSSDGYALYCNDITVKAGSQAMLPVVMKNVTSVYALQFRVALPKGVSVAYIEEDGYKRVEIGLSDRINNKKVFLNESAYMPEGLDGYENEFAWVCGVNYLNSKPLIEPGDGIIAYIPLIIDVSMTDGDYQCQVTNAEIVLYNESSPISVYPPLTTSTITVTDGSNFENTVLGDVNNDGEVNIADAMCIFSWLLENKPSVFEESVADFNQDGIITVSDGVAIIASMLDNSQSYLSCPDNHHPHMIDLGLPSGTKWACCNVGASAHEGYGGYYAWMHRVETGFRLCDLRQTKVPVRQLHRKTTKEKTTTS